MEFIETLNLMKQNLKAYHRNRNELFPLYVQERLSLSLDVYHNEMNKSLSYLNDRNNLNMMKRLNRVK